MRTTVASAARLPAATSCAASSKRSEVSCQVFTVCEDSYRVWPSSGHSTYDTLREPRQWPWFTVRLDSRNEQTLTTALRHDGINAPRQHHENVIDVHVVPRSRTFDGRRPLLALARAARRAGDPFVDRPSVRVQRVQSPAVSRDRDHELGPRRLEAEHDRGGC